MEKQQDSAAPAHGQQMISACAFIHHSFDGVEKLFLAKRAETKKFLPGVWELPGGHIDFGEDIIEGLRREVREEFDREIRVGDPFFAYTYENHVKGSHTIQVIYFAEFVGPAEGIEVHPEDHSACGWFTKDEIVGLRDEIVVATQVSYDYADDPEYLTMLRGFELLAGEPLKFA